MAENYKHLYEQTKKMLTMYQDELIPGFRKKIEELEAKVATDNNAGSKWIPVTERLPENEKCVLVYSQDGGVAEGKYNARFNEWVQFRWNVTELKNVTHWMPLPPAPKGE